MRLELKQLNRAAILIAVFFVLSIVAVTVVYTINRHTALSQTQEIADELYPMVVERDFDGMTKYFAKEDGTPVTTDEVEQYVTSMDEQSFFENLGDERLHIDVYGDANYKQMTIRLGYVDEKSAVHQLTFHLFKIDKLWKIVLEE